MADTSPAPHTPSLNTPLSDDQVPRGFSFAAVRAGLKASGNPDLACAVADQPATAAAMFTSNKVIAAPLIVGQRHLERSQHRLRVALVNAGNANCATGEAGVSGRAAMLRRRRRDLRLRCAFRLPLVDGHHRRAASGRQADRGPACTARRPGLYRGSPATDGGSHHDHRYALQDCGGEFCGGRGHRSYRRRCQGRGHDPSATTSRSASRPACHHAGVSLHRRRPRTRRCFRSASSRRRELVQSHLHRR